MKRLIKYLQRKAATHIFKALSDSPIVSFEDALIMSLHSANFTDKQMLHIVSTLTAKHHCVANVYHINAIPLVHRSIKLQLDNQTAMAITVNGLN